MPKGKESGKLNSELARFGVGAFLNKVTGIRLRLRRTKEDNLEFLKKDYNLSILQNQEQIEPFEEIV